MSEEPPTELIEARELTEWDDRDKFRHQDFADQLAELAATVPTPANIALYGPWGSGKSGIGNLIERRLGQEEFISAHPGCAVSYVRFDAFKYAETPLRRHFLSQVADQLLPERDAKQFREGLYQSEVTSRINFAQLKNGKVIIAFLVILGLGLLLAALAAAAAAAIAVLLSGDGDPGFVDRALSYFASAVGFSFAPAAVLGGMFALAGSTLPVTRTQESPSSDEQFEEQFHQLLRQAKIERLVLFVDELDRCSPHQVVDILDTIRTFLDVKGTVFIVAADQDVLERALTERVRQATPSDSSNPYYSSGSAYLDKVFHYQTSLPALLPGRITRYAVDLVRGRPGLWSDPDIDIEWLISVLIPTHVRSPRRVKTLVNNFVLAYRLAQRRHEAGHLSTPPAHRALELAKLVTLRTEFPRFARELPLSSQLPDLLLDLADEPHMAKPSGVSEEVWAKATVFLHKEEPVAVMLDDPRAHAAEDDNVRDELGVDHQVGDDDGLPAHAAASDTSAAMLLQLVHYLKKTRHIPNPHRDLVFLEAQGNLHDLDESIAEEIDDAAVGGRYEELVRLVDGLDEPGQANAVRFLAQQSRDAAPGLEGQNLVEGLLAVAGTRPHVVLDPCADEAIEAVNVHGNYGNLSEGSLAGALRLAIGTNRDGSELINHVLNHPAVLESRKLGEIVLDFGDELAGHDAIVGNVAARRLLAASTAREAATVLHGRQRSAEILDRTLQPLTELLDDAAQKDRDDPPEDPAANRAGHVAHALDAAAQQSSELGAADVLAVLIRAAFESDEAEYWSTAGAFLEHLGTGARSDQARDAVLLRCEQADAAEVGEWLQTYPDRFATTDERSEAATRVALSLWKARDTLGSDFADHDPTFVATLGELKRISRDSAAIERTQLTEQIDSELPANPEAAQTAVQDGVAWSHLRRFAEEGVLDRSAVAALIARRLRAALGFVPPPSPRIIPPDDAAQAVLLDWLGWVSPDCSTTDLAALVEALRACSWIPDEQRHPHALTVAALHAEVNPGALQSPCSHAEVVAMAESQSVASTKAVSSWLRVFADSADDVTAVLRPLHASYDRVRPGVRRYAERAGPETQFMLAANEIRSSAEDERPLNFDLLEDARFAAADEREAADLLIGEYSRTGTRNSRRRELIEAWKLLDPQGQQTRRRLIEGITLPTVEAGGNEGFRIVLREIGLLADPVGVKTRLKKALRAATPVDERDRLESAMTRHRITKTERGLLGRSREIDED